MSLNPSTTFEVLFEFMVQRIEEAHGPMPERERALLIAEAAYEAADFVLRATPSNVSHRLFLSAELLKRLRNFHSPYFVVAREMGDEEELRKLFDHFLAATEGWDATNH